MYDAFEMNIYTHEDAIFALVCFCCCFTTGTIL